MRNARGPAGSDRWPKEQLLREGYSQRGREIELVGRKYLSSANFRRVDPATALAGLGHVCVAWGETGVGYNRTKGIKPQEWYRTIGRKPRAKVSATRRVDAGPSAT